MTPPYVTNLRRVFGSHVRRCRRARGLTQTQLAEKASLSLDMVARLERGSVSPSFGTVGRLSEVLAVSPPVLLGGSPFTEKGAGEQEQLLRELFALLAGVSEGELRKIQIVIETMVRR